MLTPSEIERQQFQHPVEELLPNKRSSQSHTQKMDSRAECRWMNLEKKKNNQDRAFGKTASSAGRRAGCRDCRTERAGDEQTGSFKDTLESEHTALLPCSQLLTLRFFIQLGGFSVLCFLLDPLSKLCKSNKRMVSIASDCGADLIFFFSFLWFPMLGC